MSYQTTAPTFATGEVVTAAKLNALADGIQAAWTPYTPTPTNFTVGTGTLSGRYLRIGRTIIVRFQFVAGGTSSYTASQMQVSLPVAAHGTAMQALILRLAHSSGQYLGTIDINPTVSAVVGFVAIPTAAGDCRLLGMSNATPNPGTTGYLNAEGIYEAAV